VVIRPAARRLRVEPEFGAEAREIQDPTALAFSMHTHPIAVQA
jgi:hypothetical protein